MALWVMVMDLGIADDNDDDNNDDNDNDNDDDKEW